MAGTILVVDDNDDGREILALILSVAGYETAQACNGAEAIAQAGALKPDAIIMDVYMPVMDGITATQTLKRDPQLRHIPVIVQTAQISTAAPHSALFHATLEKPCNPNVLLTTVAAAVAVNPQHGAPHA